MLSDVIYLTNYIFESGLVFSYLVLDEIYTFTEKKGKSAIYGLV